MGLLPPMVKPRTIDDVPVVAYTLWGEEATPAELRRVAEAAADARDEAREALVAPRDLQPRGDVTCPAPAPKPPPRNAQTFVPKLPKTRPKLLGFRGAAGHCKAPPAARPPAARSRRASRIHP